MASGRWVRRLSALAAASPLHAEEARSCLEAFLATTGVPRNPNTATSLLEALEQLSATTASAVDDRAARAALGALTGRGAVASRARAVLALEQDPAGRDAFARLAGVERLRGRVERGERWLASRR
jgi:hypothetical protein